MRCLNCQNEIPDLTIVCPYCNTQINMVNQLDQQNTSSNNEFVKPNVNETIANQNINNVTPDVTPVNNNVISPNIQPKKESNQTFFMAVIIVGLIILIVFIIFVILDKTKKEDNGNQTTTTTTTKVSNVASKNKGVGSTYNYPLKVGGTTLASIYDKVNNKYTEVDVTGIRFIDEEEALVLASSYAPNETLIEGFSWNGFEYRVRFNDLDYLNSSAISPILTPIFYKWNERKFVTYNNQRYFIKLTTIDEGKVIKNNEEAIIKVIYQIPLNEVDYSICLGEESKQIGCFTK